MVFCMYGVFISTIKTFLLFSGWTRMICYDLVILVSLGDHAFSDLHSSKTLKNYIKNGCHAVERYTGICFVRYFVSGFFQGFYA